MPAASTPDSTPATAPHPLVGRFAPTPSGRMHLGNAYAMLAAWLSARKSGDRGRILLRIEDIDRPRVRPDADKHIMDDLHWLGLDWDGDPVYQSQRLDRYEEALRVLRGRTLRGVGSFDSLPLAQDDGDLEELARDDGDSVTTAQDGAAARASELGTSARRPAPTPLIYPCFCSRAEIRAASAPQEGDGFVRYPGTCRQLTAAEREVRLSRGDRHSWRIAVPDGDMRFTDRVFGPQCFDLARDLGDTVVRRSDGLFSYQLAVTVDDLEMGVTDVVRGRDLLRSTALQMWIRDNLLAAGFGMPMVAPAQVAVPSADARAHDGAARHDGSPAADACAFANHDGHCAASIIENHDDGNCNHDGGIRGDGGVRRSDVTHDAHGNAARQSDALPAPAPTPAHPAYAHLPLIDDATGRRLAKRDRALDLGVLREQGATPEQIVGRCAWWLGLQVDDAGVSLPEPVPMSADEALEAFSWDRVRAAHLRDHADYRA